MTGQTLFASDAEDEHRFGETLVLSGQRALIEGGGAAYVFEFDGQAWQEVSKITASDGTELDDVALSGNVAMIGAPSRQNDTGAVFFYHFDSPLFGATQEFDLDLGQKLTFGVNCGQPMSPVMLVLVRTGDTPMFLPVMVDQLDANGKYQVVLQAQLPPLGSLGFRLLGFSGETGKLEASDELVVDLNQQKIEAETGELGGVATIESDPAPTHVLFHSAGDSLSLRGLPPGDFDLVLTYQTKQNSNGELYELRINDNVHPVGIEFAPAMTWTDLSTRVQLVEPENTVTISKPIGENKVRIDRVFWNRVDCLPADSSEDCNANNVRDRCEIELGSSDDCNFNGVPDECELDLGNDCNGNLVPDDCDIDNGGGQDCNGNGIPDECELANANDCNGNLIPDECDLASGHSLDQDGNGIPDECQTDGVILVPDDFSDIQTAIEFANNGATIIVADGVYLGEGNRNLRFRGKAITVRSANGPANCVLDCEDQERGVVFDSHEGPSSSLVGFTIIRGVGSDGGGIFISDASPTIQNCVIRDSNGVTTGGALAMVRSSSSLIGCIFWNNNCFTDGGGVSCVESSPVIRHCTFVKNRAFFGEGGGVFLDALSTASVNHCILWSNLAAPGVQAQIGDSVGGATVTYCDVEGGWNGMGNVDVNPMFVDEAGGDLHLSSGSPTIDVGDPLFVPFLGEIDLDGDPRLLGDAVDLGADEFPLR